MCMYATATVEASVCATKRVEVSVYPGTTVEASMCATVSVEVKFWRSTQTVRLLQQLLPHPASHVHTCLSHTGYSLVHRTFPEEQRSNGRMYHQFRDRVLQALSCHVLSLECPLTVLVAELLNLPVNFLKLFPML